MDQKQRRNLLKLTAASTSALAVSGWMKPAINSVVLPVHAETSPTETTTTPAPPVPDPTEYTVVLVNNLPGTTTAMVTGAVTLTIAIPSGESRTFTHPFNTTAAVEASNPNCNPADSNAVHPSSTEWDEATQTTTFTYNVDAGNVCT